MSLLLPTQTLDGALNLSGTYLAFGAFVWCIHVCNATLGGNVLEISFHLNCLKKTVKTAAMCIPSVLECLSV